jgi:hypothetical protein
MACKGPHRDNDLRDIWRVKAILYIDETGKFQPPADDCRGVGGLLIDSSIEASLLKLHQDARDAILWPARLHAAEFGRDDGMVRYLRVWLAERLKLGVWPTCISTTKDAVAKLIQRKALAAGIPKIANWPKDVRDWKTQRPSNDDERLLVSYGAVLRDEVRQVIKKGLQTACAKTPVYFMVGHTDERLPPERAYQQCAEYVVEITKGLGVSVVELHVAQPQLGTKTPVNQIWEKASQQQGLSCVVACHNYDAGPPGLWIADSLLHWALQEWKSPLLLHQKHGLSEMCLYALSTENPPSISELVEVCKKTQNMLDSVKGGTTNV